MKKIFIICILVAVMLLAVGCGGNGGNGSGVRSGSNRRNAPIEATFGSTFTSFGFEITVADTWVVEDFGLDNDWILIPISITNISNRTTRLNAMSTIWSPNGLSIALGGLSDSPEMRQGASFNTDIRFPFQEDGAYVVELTDGMAGSAVEAILTLPITMQATGTTPSREGNQTTPSNWQDAGDVQIPPDWNVDDSMDATVVFGMVGGQEIELVANWIEEDFQWLVDSANTSSHFTFADGMVGYRLDFPEEIMWINPTAHRALTFRHRGQIGLYNAGSDVINSIAATLRNPWMD